MAGQSRYVKQYCCTVCEQEVSSRDRLTVKKIEFRAMGSGGRTFRSRVVAWLCPDCLVKDPDWNREAYADPSETVAVSPNQLSIPTS